MNQLGPPSLRSTRRTPFPPSDEARATPRGLGADRPGGGLYSPSLEGRPHSTMPSGRSFVPFRSSAKRDPPSKPGKAIRYARSASGMANAIRAFVLRLSQFEPSRLEDDNNGSAT